MGFVGHHSCLTAGKPTRAGGSAVDPESAGFKMPVCSTTRVKSAIVLSLMIDGSGSFDCRIFARLRPVRIVRKRGAIQSFRRSPQRATADRGVDKPAATRLRG